MVTGDDIDVVLLYVDGAAPGYRELHERHAGPVRPCQVRTLGEVRFALRSIELFAPWARRVHLVVQDERHVPSWMDRRTVEVVPHGAFIDSDVLPTFNQFPIQAHLHRIPGLREHFVLWHDDYLLGRPVTPDDWFDERGDPRTDVYDSPVPLWLTRFRSDVYMQFLVETARVFERAIFPSRRPSGLRTYLYPHMPLPARASWWAEMVTLFATDPTFYATRRRKAEGTGGAERGVLLDVLFANLADHRRHRRSAPEKLARCLARRWPSSGPRTGIYGIRNDAAHTRREMQRLRRERATFLCVNDDAYDDVPGHSGGAYDVHPDSLAAFEATMQELYPTPSRFEEGRSRAPDARQGD